MAAFCFRRRNRGHPRQGEEGAAAPSAEPGSAGLVDHAGNPMPRGQYDLRIGASGYSPVVGTVGGFAVAGIVLLFTIPSGMGSNISEAMLAKAAALMTLALVACVMAAIGMAAIAGESQLTVNLPPALMYSGVAAVTGVVALPASFEVLASELLPSARGFLLLITVGTAVVGILFTSFSIPDGYFGRVAGTSENDWLQTRLQAYRTGCRVALVACLPIMAVVTARAVGVQPDAGTDLFGGIVTACVVATFAATVAASVRTAHAGRAMGAFKLAEAVAALSVLSVSLAALILVLP